MWILVSWSIINNFSCFYSWEIICWTWALFQRLSIDSAQRTCNSAQKIFNSHNIVWWSGRCLCVQTFFYILLVFVHILSLNMVVCCMRGCGSKRKTCTKCCLILYSHCAWKHGWSLDKADHCTSSRQLPRVCMWGMVAWWYSTGFMICRFPVWNQMCATFSTRNCDRCKGVSAQHRDRLLLS